MEMNGSLTIGEQLIQHTEHIREVREDVESTKRRVAEEATAGELRTKALAESIQRIESKLDRVLTQKKVIIAIVVFAVGALGAGIPWVMRAQMRELLLETRLIEMRAIK
jgi:hypothetical protein